MHTLISFAGLPGVGKTTIARQLARQQGIPYLRVDEIEGVLMADAPGQDIGPQGYQIAAALAASNLTLGLSAIVDCVNPWQLTRDIFIETARTAGSAFFGVELYCSDEAEHRRRVETRQADIPGKSLPDWQKVMARDYHPWTGADLRIDTAATTIEQAADEIIRTLGSVTQAGEDFQAGRSAACASGCPDIAPVCPLNSGTSRANSPST